MRVIAGSLGGRRLRPVRGRTTRPTSDRVREGLFGLLGDVQGSSVLDLFAGTGGLGIEALSRGAERVVFVERDRAALRGLRANLDALGIGPGAAEVRHEHARTALRTARERQETYDLVFIDPPYGQGRDWAAELSVALPPLLSPAARVAVESDQRAPLRLDAEVEKSRRYGDTSITIYRQK